MIRLKSVGMLLGVVLGAALSAQAATLQCDGAVSGKVTIPLTGYSFSTTAPISQQTGMATGRSSFELTVRFATGQELETLLLMVQRNEAIRTCTLVDTNLGGGSRVGMGGKSAGSIQWDLTHVAISSITATEGMTGLTIPESGVQAVMTAQSYQVVAK